MSSGHSYLALGDSYTIGQSVPDSDRYPVQLVHLLSKKGIQFSSPEIIARTGWTTGDLLHAIPPSKASYDIVTLLIGVNDQYQGLSRNQYRTAFAELLDSSIKYARNGAKCVIVLSIPDYSVTPFANSLDTAAIAREIDAFNAINKEISIAKGVNYLEITVSTRMAKFDDSLVAYDGLHPSGKEYKKWANRLAVLIKTIL
ncbi:MAG: SGNH/GDSL hydrolase family protein [Sphingobacteriales bacterium]|nr:SGNH/GDSL hydrolase family protein [Sphingobacteriales bacterium]